ncbi:alpha/beta fold hydrolase [Galbitalea sp. SE-J8]|uniref:alpha/beta fold hydrolase n=1 Tax=Galbitalea sp. SE-J8 TaxID=3054952 RepID=UPI00259D2F31|nr:alpha/beta fold hydrolase [Galbitalea sp. SE-J8]MDM4763860.1 alpha/beta fold hydrolase [Galbitalea sp. SE-J8]
MAAASPTPRGVIATDGIRLATYEWGDPDAPPVLAVHGFASSAIVNWFDTGWARDLDRAGMRIVALDQRGHGASDKPHRAEAYSMTQLVTDVLTVLDTYMLDEAAYLGYSLGGRVGWQACLDLPHRIPRAVLGGVPDGQPLTRFDTDAARAYLDDGTPVGDRLTNAYVTMADRIPGNDLVALVALVEGMKNDAVQPDPADPPRQPLLLATGTEDPIIERSRALADAAPLGAFVPIPARNHFTAPVSHHFRRDGIAFLAASGARGPA